MAQATWTEDGQQLADADGAHAPRAAGAGRAGVELPHVERGHRAAGRGEHEGGRQGRHRAADGFAGLAAGAAAEFAIQVAAAAHNGEIRKERGWRRVKVRNPDASPGA